MIPRSVPRSLALLAAGAAVVALAGCGGPADTGTSGSTTGGGASPVAAATPAAKRVEFTVTGGQVRGGLAVVDVPLGTPVTFVVTSDRADEAHLHGYDRKLELTPGTPGTLTFVADNPGVFAFELHGADAQLARVEVR